MSSLSVKENLVWQVSYSQAQINCLAISVSFSAAGGFSKESRRPSEEIVHRLGWVGVGEDIRNRRDWWHG